VVAPLSFDIDSVRDGLESAVDAAADAIREVLKRDQIRVAHKPGEGPVTEADHAADDVLNQRLMPLIEGSHWLSEESRQDVPLIRGEPTWVVDPLDGTREFIRGIPEYGVSVGLFVGDELVLGALALPVQGDVFSGLTFGDRSEFRRDGESAAALPPFEGVERVVVSRFDYERRRIHYQIPYDVYPCGSAAVKLAHAAEGEADVYFSTGPRSVWDVAGGAAVLNAAGGMLVTFDGQPLELSPLEIGVPPYMAGRRDACLALLRKLGAAV
jgi:fructose-1,6-bisphosphatase/inositol monophosphatase family enzyme